MNLLPWFLFAHVLGAIIAFGSAFSALPILGAMGGREPMHGNFAVRASSVVSERVIIPFAILQALTGIGLIWTAQIDLFSARWLLLAIVLYLCAIGYAIFVQTPAARRMIELTSGGPPPAGTPGQAPAGPPPEIMALGARLRRGGMLLAGLVAVIVFLMVVKPF